MPFIITSYNKDKRNIFAEFNRNALSGNATGEQRLAAFKEYILDSFESQKIFGQVLEDMETMGISKFKLEDILDDRLTKSEVRNFEDKTFKVPGFSETAFEALIGRLKLEDPLEAARISSEIRSAIISMDILRDRLSLIKLSTSREDLEKRINTILFPKIERFRELRETPPSVSEPKAELPTDQRAAIQPSSNVIAQTIKQPSLTELAKGNLGNQFNLFRTI